MIKGGRCGFLRIDELGASAKMMMNSSNWVVLEVALLTVWSDWWPCFTVASEARCYWFNWQLVKQSERATYQRRGIGMGCPQMSTCFRLACTQAAVIRCNGFDWAMNECNALSDWQQIAESERCKPCPKGLGGDILVDPVVWARSVNNDFSHKAIMPVSTTCLYKLVWKWVAISWHSNDFFSSFIYVHFFFSHEII
jgi:hypothetical protein